VRAPSLEGSFSSCSETWISVSQDISLCGCAGCCVDLDLCDTKYFPFLSTFGYLFHLPVLSFERRSSRPQMGVEDNLASAARSEIRIRFCVMT
jgi:hypothetical protein